MLAIYHLTMAFTRVIINCHCPTSPRSSLSPAGTCNGWRCREGAGGGGPGAERDKQGGGGHRDGHRGQEGDMSCRGQRRTMGRRAVGVAEVVGGTGGGAAAACLPRTRREGGWGFLLPWAAFLPCWPRAEGPSGRGCWCPGCRRNSRLVALMTCSALGDRSPQRSRRSILQRRPRSIND